MCRNSILEDGTCGVQFYLYTRLCVRLYAWLFLKGKKKLIQLLTDLSASVFRVAVMCVAVNGETWGNDHPAGGR